MANFNIKDSQVEQLNDQGDNIKVTGNTGPVAITQGEGQTTQTTGNENEVSVQPKSNWLAALVKKVKSWWAGS